MNTTAHDFICYGELLWDILPSGAKPGGAPMNVAFHLNRLGHRPAVITRVGKDKLGEELLSIISAKKIDGTYIQTDNSVPTGIVHASPNEHGEMSYEIVAPAAWDGIEWDDRFESLFNDQNYLVFGSLICRNKQSRDTLFGLIELARNKVLDINLRPPHFSRELLLDLLDKATIVKLNQSELKLIADWSSDYVSVEDQVRHIQEKFDIPTLIITLGGDGALMSGGGQIARHPGYHIVVEDTVGSGDAFLAALLSGISKNHTAAECLSFACAIGALVTSKKGAWPEYEVEEISSLREKGSEQ